MVVLVLVIPIGFLWSTGLAAGVIGQLLTVRSEQAAEDESGADVAEAAA
ncbi:MAG: hypothetical protein ACK5PP_02215 [Acidimicrobiales bacterium]